MAGDWRFLMPKLYRKSNGVYYTKTLNNSRQVITLQIKSEGAAWLRNGGFDVEQELGTAFWDLYENNWLYTLGDVTGGGELDIPTNWIQHEALGTHPLEMEPVSDEPLTIPTDSEFANAPRFLFAPNTSIYYTILSVENSSDQWLEVPLLIKSAFHNPVRLW